MAGEDDTTTDTAVQSVRTGEDGVSTDGGTAAATPGGGDRSGAESSAPSGAQAPGWAKIVTVVASVLIVALVASGVWLLLEARSAQDRDERRAQFVQAARQTVLNVTTIAAETAHDDVQRILDGATGDFRAEFEGREGPFAEVVQQIDVNSTGEVVEAGVQTEDGPCIASLVAARAVVSNASAPEPSPRDFRLRVTICDEDGQLLASKVEFVP